MADKLKTIYSQNGTPATITDRAWKERKKYYQSAGYTDKEPKETIQSSGYYFETRQGVCVFYPQENLETVRTKDGLTTEQSLLNSGCKKLTDREGLSKHFSEKFIDQYLGTTEKQEAKKEPKENKPEVAPQEVVVEEPQ